MKRDLPAISSEIASRPRGQIEAIREAVQVLIGTRGDRLDRAITFRDLVLNADGSITIGGGELGGGTSGGTIVINPPGAGEEPDLTPPPTPTGLVVTGGLTAVYIEWEVAVYTLGHGPGQTNIYGAKWPADDLTPPTFAEAVLVGVAPHALTLYALETEPATRWCIWIKFQSADGVESATPAGGANGAQATTGQDPEQLLEVLTGEITAGQLHASLGTRIDLIDGPPTMDGSVNARVQTVESIATSAQTAAAGAAASASATAALVTTVQSQVNQAAGIDPLRSWGFAAGTEGWLATAATLESLPSGVLRWTATGANATLAKTFVTAERYQGALATLVRARVRRVSGTGTWEGSCYYQTAGHSNSNSFRKLVAVPATPGDWTVLEWDMRALDAGGTDYVDNEVLGLRIDLVSDAGSGWEIDYIQVGAPSVMPLAAAVQQEITTRADQAGYLGAQYTLRVTAGNLIGGFGIAGTAAPGAQPTIDFGVRANKFFIAPPEGSGNTGTLPFVVTTTTTTLNGVSVPPGTYINTAFIRNGTITDAMIGTATITSAKIASLDAAQLTAGNGTIGGNLRSSNFVGGSAGWILQPNGYAEFSNVVIRGATYTGTIFANAGTIGAIEINATDIRSTSYVANTSGFMLQSNGNVWINTLNARGSINGGAFTSFNWPAAGSTGFHLSASGLRLGNANDGTYFQVLPNGTVTAPEFSISGGNATFSGNLSAAGGTFAGNLSAAGGTFAGTLTAAAVNAVDTINLRGNAVTIPVGSSFTANVALGTGYTTVCSVSVNTSGQPIIALANATIRSGEQTTVTGRILIAGSAGRTATIYVPGNAVTGAAVVLALSAIDATPGSGSVTVSFQLQCLDGGVNPEALDGNLVVIGLKR